MTMGREGGKVANKSVTGVRELHTRVMPRLVSVENITRHHF
jgi:hypothetical protein